MPICVLAFLLMSGALAPLDTLHSRHPVPAIPPDSVPAYLRDTTTWTSGEPHVAGTIMRDIVVLRFRPGTPQTARQSAVDLVGGVVVGGRSSGHGDGVYLVRVPTDGTIEPLLKAIARLRVLPQVSLAMPNVIIPLEP